MVALENRQNTGNNIFCLKEKIRMWSYDLALICAWAGGGLFNYSLTEDIKTEHVVGEMDGFIVAKSTGN